MSEESRTGLEIAIIGMTGRFPGAQDLEQFWDNLINGRESVVFYSEAELLEAGLDPVLLQNPGYVKSDGGILQRKEYFDASFFEYTPSEALLMDPQIRIFHECAWEALEDAGYDPSTYKGYIGLYAGSDSSLHWERIAHLSRTGDQFGVFVTTQLSDKDYLATRVSYKLDLKGPALVVRTACSTALVVIHLACRTLLTGDCHMALAGGVSVNPSPYTGYLYQEGMVFSPDGHCRAFDAQSRGTIPGNGVGVIVLKPLQKAAADGDHIYALIKGSAINNDGIRKMGFSAPSVQGQTEVIRAAQRFARISPESITYIETHGTGTSLGDAIEIQALKAAFNISRKGVCAIGSVKTNVGHLGAAAGMVGFIKAVLALKNKCIPPTLHFQFPNPQMDLENSPFFVNTTVTLWKSNGNPLRAGVSSFGIGGTNAHIVLEEWPVDSESVGQWVSGSVGQWVNGQRTNGRGGSLGTPHQEQDYQLIVLSAKTSTALERMTENLAGYLKKNPGINIADAAYTLQVGRQAFIHREIAVCSTIDEAVEVLSARGERDRKVEQFFIKENKPPVIFMFSGQGTQYVNMALGLYRHQPEFQKEIDRCSEILKPLTGYDLRAILYPGIMAGASDAANLEPGEWIYRQDITQPLMFVFEYSLARLLMNWGIRPDAMIGYSIGEYVAACLAEVLSLEDAVNLVAIRGKLMHEIPGGLMLNVPLPEEELKPLMDEELSLAVVNGPSCIVSGPEAAIERFEKQLKQKNYICMRLSISHAGHSKMMAPMLPKFKKEVEKVRLKPPKMPFISSVTATWIQDKQALDPQYWSDHLQKTVRFTQGLKELVKKPHAIFIEIGPGRDLKSMLGRYIDKKSGQKALNLIPPLQKSDSDIYFLLNAIGHLWLYGVPIDWQAFHAAGKRQRLALPTYPFAGRRCWFPGNPFRLRKEALTASSISAAAGKTGITAAIEPEVSETTRIEADATSLEQLEQRPGLHSEYIPPANETQHILVNLWEEFFGIRPIGIDDDFFDLGGDSLKAAVVIARIQNKLGVSIPMAEFFKRPTVKSLVLFLSGRERTDIYSSLEAVEEKEYYPLSAAQKRLFIIQQINEDKTGYNEMHLVRLEGKPDKNRMKEVFFQLIQRHESLRTSFRVVAEEPVQAVHKKVDFEITYHQVEVETEAGKEEGRGEGEKGRRVEKKLATEITGDTGEENYKLQNTNYKQNTKYKLQITNKKETVAHHLSINRIIHHCLLQPFDLSQAPLLRVVLIKENESSHVLAVFMHHIITDGTSLTLLANEFLALYTGQNLPPLKIRYKDYSQRQYTQAVKTSYLEQEAYWLRQLEGEIPVLNLFTDFPRLAAQSFAGDSVEFDLETGEVKTFKEIAHQEGVTLFMLLLAVYNVLLSKLSSQEDIIVGTPIAGRRHTDLERIIGMFVNTLALRNYPSGEKAFNILLRQVKESTLQAFEHQDYPFEELVETVEVERDISRNPLFDALFVVQNFVEPPSEKLEQETAKAGLIVKPYIIEHKIAKFDLGLFAIEMENGLHFIFEYCAQLFKKETILRYIEYFKKIILSVIRDRSEKISRIEIISEEEKQQLLIDFNETRAGYPGNQTLHRLFEEQVAKNPDRIALSEWKENREECKEVIEISYRELNTRSNRLALLLKGKGVQPDTIVALLLSPSIEMIAGIMAVLKAGGAYLPIDPEYPQERIDYMLKDSGSKILVTDIGKTGEFEELLMINCELLMVNEKSPNRRGLNKPPKEANLINNYQLTINNLQLKQTNLAYIIYTSGTTGKPKGVLIEHRNVVRLLFNDKFQFDFNHNDVWTMFHSYCFDFSVWEMYGALLYGGQLVLISRMTARNPERFLDIMNEKKVSVLNQTPSSFYALMEIESKRPPKKLLLKYVIFGGEALKPGKIKEWKSRYPDTRLINMYGITETTVHVTYKEITAKEIEVNISNIGKPIPTLHVFVVARPLNLVPIGVPGELCVGGEGVGRGYLNRPELTAEKFYNENYQKFLRGPGAVFLKSAPGRRRLYKSGDLARILPGGDIEYLGRIDQQVKIRGFRVELGEIESQLEQLDKIKEAIVLVKENKSGEKYLCAYITAQSAERTAPGQGDIGKGDSKERKQEPSPGELREFLARTLPDYMIPSYFVIIDRIPLTPNGKINRKALPEPKTEVAATAGQYTAPRDKAEEKLVEIWSEILAIEKEKIGIENSFFQLGGNSLSLIKMVSQVYKSFAVEVSFTRIFANPVIKEISNYIKSKQYIEEPVALLNQLTGKKVFCFPPAVAFGVIYQELASLITGYAFYSFNFIEDENRLQKYTDIMANLQPQGPYILLGYSAGGKLCFETARALENSGREVSDIILLDSFFTGDKKEVFTREELDDWYKGIEKYLEDIGAEVLKGKVLERTEKYLSYYEKTTRLEVINARVQLVLSEESLNKEIYDPACWDRLTGKTSVIYQGFGGHNDMLSPGSLEKNAEIIQGILDAI